MALENHELACVYAALILADEKIPVSEDKISAILKAANYNIEPLWAGLFANALKGIEINDLIKNIGAAPAAGAAAPAQAATTTAAAADSKPAAAAKKEEKPAAKEESDEEMGFGLFD